MSKYIPDPTWHDKCKRCMEDGLEADEYCVYYGEPNGCNSPLFGDYPMLPQAQAVRMRQALEKVVELLMRKGNGYTRCVLSWDEFNSTVQMCRAALAEDKDEDVH